MNNVYIKRKLNKSTNKFNFYTINNKKITDKKILEKINKIYIAPAYRNVKIYLNKELLATGVDNAGRTQYIYSNYSKEKREIKKLNKLNKLSNNILELKKKINKDLLLKDFCKNKLIALVLKIMDLCNFRGGNKKYEKKYGSYGITTLHKKHILIKNNIIEIDFIGKKGVNNFCMIQNKTIQDIIKKVYHLSSKDNAYLFSIIYKNEHINISINDLNQYLKEFDVTTKDLRTWNANILFLKNLKKYIDNLNSSYYEKDENKKIKIRKKMIKEAIKDTAFSLHHTPSICKSSYIFKNIIAKIEKNDVFIKHMLSRNIIFEKLIKKIL